MPAFLQLKGYRFGLRVFGVFGTFRFFRAFSVFRGCRQYRPRERVVRRLVALPLCHHEYRPPAHAGGTDCPGHPLTLRYWLQPPNPPKTRTPTTRYESGFMNRHAHAVFRT